MTAIEIATPEDAARAIEHWNAFHDGFVREIRVRSHDRFEREGPAVTDIVHRLTGRFDVTLDVAHYNYAAGTQPHDRVVRCLFFDAAEIRVDLRATRPHEWPLQELAIEPLDGGAGAAGGPRLALSWTHSHLVEGRWERRSERLFTFRRARFEELLAEG